MPHTPMNQLMLISDLLRRAFKARRAVVGISFSGHGETLERLLLEPHRFVVFGEKFHPMFRVQRRAARNAGGNLRDDIVFLEGRFSNLPLAPGHLDALILLGGLPRTAKDPLLSLMQLRTLLKPGGLLIWPQVLGEGFFGRLARLRYAEKNGAVGTPERTTLCRLAMEAGFLDIGQTPLKTRAVPWAVTYGRAVSRAWESERRPDR